MEALAGDTGLIPEQIWDAADIPERELHLGRPSGSAMPLVWAHAEYVKLRRSLHDGKVFDTPHQTLHRYANGKGHAPHALWRFDQQRRWLPAGKVLRIEVGAAAVVRWSADNWKTSHDLATRASGLGLHLADVPTEGLAAGAEVVFTFRWDEGDRWEGHDFRVTVAAAPPLRRRRTDRRIGPKSSRSGARPGLATALMPRSIPMSQGREELLLAPYRPPLGLPFGSVRAVLALAIGAMFWTLVLFSTRADQFPLYLYFLLALELLFFTAHGYSIASAKSARASPWWLPAGFFRAVIFLGFVATVAWRYHQDPDRLQEVLTPSPEQAGHFPYLLLAVALGFTVGRLLRLGPWQKTAGFQDIQAWLALLAMLGLAGEIVVVVFINPTVTQKVDLKTWEYVLTGIVTCYFAVRC